MNKTKVMTQKEKTCNIEIRGVRLEQVDTFRYLGSLITEDAADVKDIREKLARGLNTITTLKQLWKSHNIKMDTKMKLMRALVWPVATYGCESWTIKKKEEERINAFEMKCLRQILRVSWIEKRTNEWVLEKTGTERSLLNQIKRRKLTYFGHLMRKRETAWKRRAPCRLRAGRLRAVVCAPSFARSRLSAARNARHLRAGRLRARSVD